MLLKQPWVTLTRMLYAASATGPASPPPPPGAGPPGGPPGPGLDTGAGPVTYPRSPLVAADDLVLCHRPHMRPPGPAALAFLPHELY
jgi:hypothetical protein